MSSIVNIDDILDYMHAGLISCDIFTGFESEYFPKENAEQDMVFLQKNLKGLNFGSVAKMWVNWNALDPARLEQLNNATVDEYNSSVERLEYLETHFSLNPFKRKRMKKEKKALEQKLEELNILFKKLRIANDVLQRVQTHKTGVKESFLYEKCVYDYITKNIILTKISPNFIPLLGFVQCNLGSIAPTLENISYMVHARRTVYQDLAQFYPDVPVNLMITGSSARNGGTLTSFYEYLGKTTDRLLESVLEGDDPSMYLFFVKSKFIDVFFQCIYSLAVMEYFEITHNDLHFDNILIHELPEDMQLTFQTPKRRIRMTTSHIPKFFDWNLAFVKDIGNNPFLETNGRYRYHMVNKVRSHQDMYQFLCELSKSPKLYHYVKELIPTLPEKLSSYNFDRKKLSEKFSILRSDDPFLKILNYVLSAPKEDVKVFGTDLFLEINKDTFVQFFTVEVLNSKIIPVIGVEHFNLSSRLYFRLQFLKDKSPLTFPLLRSDVSEILLIVDPGWNCQSLYDADASIIPSALTLLNDEGFLDRLENYIPNYRLDSDAKKFEYTFPTGPRAVQDVSCARESEA